jgi:hypothetical protein
MDPSRDQARRLARHHRCGARQARRPDSGSGGLHADGGVRDDPSIRRRPERHFRLDPDGPEIVLASNENPAGRPADVVDGDDEDVIVSADVDVDRRAVNAPNAAAERRSGARDVRRQAGRAQGGGNGRQGSLR